MANQNAKRDDNKVPVLLVIDEDGNTKMVKGDNTTGAVVTVSEEHHEVHSGCHFSYSESNLLNADGSAFILMVTPDTTDRIHLLFQSEGSFVTQVDLFEGSTHAAGTTKISFNNDRNSSSTAAMTLHIPTLNGSDGTAIFTQKFGVATGTGVNSIRFGGSTRGDQEFILKQNTKYILKTASSTNSNQTATVITWYEE